MRTSWFVLSFFLAGRALAGTTSLSLGADYTSGDYGSGEATRTWTVPVSLKHESGPWIFRASVPYVRVEGGFSRDSQGQAVEREVQSGIGDTVLAAFYNVLDSRRLAVDIGAKAKLATADSAKDLITTGENDYSLQVDLFRTMASTSLFASLGYTVKGDSAAVRYRNPLYGALGMTVPLARRQSLGLAWDYREKSIDGGAEISELTLFFSRKLDANDRLQLYAVHGLADGSPDFGGGAVLTRSF